MKRSAVIYDRIMIISSRFFIAGDLAPMLPKRQQLEDRLRDLTHQADIMVFMKGAPQVSPYLSAVIRIRRAVSFWVSRIRIRTFDQRIRILSSSSKNPGSVIYRYGTVLSPYPGPTQKLAFQRLKVHIFLKVVHSMILWTERGVKKLSSVF